jgi:hypothetical protein
MTSKGCRVIRKMGQPESREKIKFRGTRSMSRLGWISITTATASMPLSLEQIKDAFYIGRWCWCAKCKRIVIIDRKH